MNNPAEDLEEQMGNILVDASESLKRVIRQGTRPAGHVPLRSLSG